ncbi:MAG: response regulator transcription factor [Solobacterium sp.]|nr:response regulator transcription factor [Solobacterium sp.]
MLDSAMVLFTGVIRISTLPAAAVLAVNIAGNAVIILLMALGGDFNLTEPPGAIVGAVEEESRKEEPAEERPALLSGDDALARMQERYALTARETEVLRELVLTEDKQTVISERLSIRVKTLQDYVTRLYRKTGAATRSGLTELYHRNMRVE